MLRTVAATATASVAAAVAESYAYVFEISVNAHLIAGLYQARFKGSKWGVVIDKRFLRSFVVKCQSVVHGGNYSKNDDNPIIFILEFKNVRRGRQTERCEAEPFSRHLFDCVLNVECEFAWEST